MSNELAYLLREAAHELSRPRAPYAKYLRERLEAAAAEMEAQEPSLFVTVGNLPTMNQDEYPGLGDWWVQLRTGEGNDEVFARVYGDSPDKARERACIVRDALGRPPTSAVPDVMELVRVQHEVLEELWRAAGDSDDCQYGTLDTDFVRSVSRSALTKYNEMMGEKE